MNRNHQPTVLRDQVFRVEKVIHSAGGRKDTSKERGLSFSPPNPRAILGTPPPEPQLLSPPATCDCRPADNMLLATLGARQRVSESRGAPAVPHHFERVGSRRTGCSNSHRFSSPALPRLGCSLPLCLVSLLTRKPSNAVNKKAQIWLFAPSVCLVSLLTRKPRCLLVTVSSHRARGVRTRLYCTVLNWKLHEHTHPTTRRTPTRVHGVSYMGVETRDSTDTASCI